MYSNNNNNNNEEHLQDTTTNTQVEEVTTPPKDGKCYLPSIIKMPTSPDGSYTPPSPHHSLVRAVGFASNEEYQEYCYQYDFELGAYSDIWKYNEKGECGNWQDQYTKLHAQNRKYLAQYQEGEFPMDLKVPQRPKFVSYLCKEVPKDSNRGCGGLADRMGGKLSTYFV